MYRSKARCRCWRLSASILLAPLLLAVGMGPLLAAAETAALQSTERIAEAAMAHVRREMGGAAAQLRALPVDPRLRLARCDLPLETESTNRSSGRIAVRVSCPGPQPWRLYVRVEARRFAAVLVAARHLSAGTVLNAQNMRSENRDLSRLPMGYAQQLADISGRRLKRSLRAGEVIPMAALARDLLVRNGDPVSIVSGGSGYRISMRGTALRDGTLGARVSVRNQSSGRIVEGRVIDRATVQVSPGPDLPTGG